MNSIEFTLLFFLSTKGILEKSSLPLDRVFIEQTVINFVEILLIIFFIHDSRQFYVSIETICHFFHKYGWDSYFMEK